MDADPDFPGGAGGRFDERFVETLTLPGTVRKTQGDRLPRPA